MLYFSTLCSRRVKVHTIISLLNLVVSKRWHALTGVQECWRWAVVDESAARGASVARGDISVCNEICRPSELSLAVLIPRLCIFHLLKSHYSGRVKIVVPFPILTTSGSKVCQNISFEERSNLSSSPQPGTTHQLVRVLLLKTNNIQFFHPHSTKTY